MIIIYPDGYITEYFTLTRNTENITMYKDMRLISKALLTGYFIYNYIHIYNYR